MLLVSCGCGGDHRRRPSSVPSAVQGGQVCRGTRAGAYSQGSTRFLRISVPSAEALMSATCAASSRVWPSSPHSLRSSGGGEKVREGQAGTTKAAAASCGSVEGGGRGRLCCIAAERERECSAERVREREGMREREREREEGEGERRFLFFCLSSYTHTHTDTYTYRYTDTQTQTQTHTQTDTHVYTARLGRRCSSLLPVFLSLF